MTLQEIIKNLLEQAKDKECFADADDPEDILRKDVLVLRETARLLSKTELLNAPLTIAELQDMAFGEWVWIENLQKYSFDILSGYYQKVNGYRPEDAFYFGRMYERYDRIEFNPWARYKEYGTTWLAYRRRPEEGTG